MRGRESLAPLRATPLEHQATVLGGHTRPEAMRLGAAAIIGLKCSLRHKLSILQLNEKSKTNCRLPLCQEGAYSFAPIQIRLKKLATQELFFAKGRFNLCSKIVLSGDFPSIPKRENPIKMGFSTRAKKIFPKPVDFPCFQTQFVLVSAPFLRPCAPVSS
jgi:hypothetical protein